MSKNSQNNAKNNAQNGTNNTQNNTQNKNSAENRSVFASGALKAAAFLQAKSPARYDMTNLVEEV